MPTRLALAATIVFALSACGGGGEGAIAPAASGLRIVAGAWISDTAWARPVQALVVEVHPSTGSAAGLEVRFQALPTTDSARPTASMYVFNAASNGFSPFAIGTTNSSGRVSVPVQLGPIAGEGGILVSVPELGLSETAKFTVLPGKAALVVIGSADTTLLAGASYTINAYASDANGNRRSEALTFTAGENVASVDQSGRVTAGATIGRGSVAVRVGNSVDSARFAVVPSGTMTFIDAGTGKISTANLDGSNKKPLVSPGFDPAYPHISPDGNLVVYQQNESDRWVLYLVDANGTKRQLVSPTVMSTGIFPHFSGDGAWVFFSGVAVGDSTSAIWRIHPDGTSLTRVVDLPSLTLTQLAVAPDGSRVVYSENYQNYEFTVLQLATGAKVLLGQYGSFPEFSPDSRRLAFLNGGAITIANIDGTSPINVAVNRVDGGAGLTWTPDGGWLLVRGYDGPILVSATTGEVISLPFANFFQFSATR